MKKTGFLIFPALICALITAVFLSVTAAAAPISAAQAPGGEVKTAEQLVAALGGEDNVDLGSDGKTVYLSRDILLMNSVIIRDGDYRIVGRGCTVYRGSADMEAMFFLTAASLSEGSPSLILGTDSASSDDAESADLIFDGNRDAFDTPSNGPIFGLIGKVSLRINPAVWLINNCSSAPGGAIYMSASVYGNDYTPLPPELTVNGALFENNSSTVDGGAIYLKGEGQSESAGQIILNSTALKGNTVESGEYVGRGGAICADGGALTMTSCSVESNIADNGGGVYASFETLITACGFRMNRATLSGGALYFDGDGYDPQNENSAPGTLTGVFIEQNSSGGTGGAITNFGNLTVSAEEITYISENTAVGDGACIYNEGLLTLNGGQLFFNKSTEGRGGIFNGGSLIFTAAELRKNSARVGGAVYNEGEFKLTGGSIASNVNLEKNTPQLLNRGSLTFGGSFVIDGDIVGNCIHVDESGASVIPTIFVESKLTTAFPIKVARFVESKQGDSVTYSLSNEKNASLYYGKNENVESAAAVSEVYHSGFGGYKVAPDGTLKFLFPVMPLWAWLLSVLGSAAVAVSAVIFVRKRKKTAPVSEG